MKMLKNAEDATLDANIYDFLLKFDEILTILGGIARPLRRRKEKKILTIF